MPSIEKNSPPFIISFLTNVIITFIGTFTSVMRVVQSINKLQFVACNNFKVSFRFFFPSDKQLEKLDLVVCCDHDLKREESEFGPEFHLRGKRKQTETVFPIFPLAI